MPGAATDDASIQGYRIRRRVISECPSAFVLETNGGDGFYFNRVWFKARGGLAFHRDGAAALAHARPTWAIYQADATRALAAGMASAQAFDVIDVDAHKRAIPILDAIMRPGRAFPARWHLVVRDRARGAAPNLTGVQLARVAQIFARYGGALRDHYADALRASVTAFADVVGFEVTHCEIAHCGKRGAITDLWARLDSRINQ